MLLEVANLLVCYDKAMIINDLSMGVDREELVSLVRHAPDDASRRWVMEHPKQALEASRGRADEVQVDPRLSAQGQRLQRTLRITLASMSRLIHLLPPRLDPPDRPLLALDVRRLRDRSEEMACQLGPENSWPSDDRASESGETG